MDSLLRLISNQTFSIEPAWGLSKLQEILMLKELNTDMDAALKSIKEESRSIEYYSTDGALSSEIDGQIAKVSMSGVMTVEDGLCHYGMNNLDRTMRKLYSNNSIKGIILSVNSGGGYSTAGDVLYNTIADKNKPVVVHAVYMASAALKGTLKANEIIAASDSTEIGSIGTMMVMPKWYLESAKQNDIELYSTKSPEKNAAWRAIKDGNFEPYIKELTKNDEVFMDIVKNNRNLKGDVESTLSGATFLAKDAKRRGLIDGIGSLDYAIKRLRSHISYNK